MKKLLSMMLTTIMMVSMLSFNVGAIDYTDYSQKFSDVSPTHWAFAYIGEMSKRGIVSGYPDGKYYPNNNVTRAEFATIMVNAAGISISEPSKNDFSDVSTTAWYAPYVHAAYPYLSGYGYYYYPDTPAVREDIAVALVKIKGYDISNADVSALSNTFIDSELITQDAKKYVAVAVEQGLISGYEDRTFKGQANISRAEVAAMIWRAFINENNGTNTNTNVPMVTATPTSAPSTIAPTVTPVSNVTPVPTVKPTPVLEVEPTEEPIIEPTEEPEPEYKYSVDTICNAYNLENMTVANTGYVYYEEDNIVYECDIESGDVQEFFNPEDMEYNDGNALRSDFNIDLIFFNNYSDKLYMCGHYTAKDYEENLTNCAIYEITDQIEKNVYFSETYGYVKSYFYSVLPVSKNMVYIYSENSISTKNDYSVWFDLNSGTYLKAGSAFYKDEYIFNGDNEYYTVYQDKLMRVGGKSATGTPEGIKSLTDNAMLSYGDMNNTQGFTGYNKKLYYAGETSGDIYCIDLEGNTSKYISSKDVYQHGDDFVDTSFYARLQYFSMEYNGLPIWYDDSLKAIKRYVKN